MIFNSKKLEKHFSREIRSLEALGSPEDALSQSELEGIKQKVLRAIANAPKDSAYSWREKSYRAARYAVALAAGFSLIAGTAFASNNSIPGDLLYPVKIVQEKVQLSLATSDEAKVNLEAKFAQTRLDELQKLSVKIQSEKAANNVNVAMLRQPAVATSSAIAITAIQPAVTASAVPTFIQPNNSGSRLEAGFQDEQLQKQARQEASLEVKNALTNLNRVHLQLQAKGNKKDAASVQASILSLQLQAKAENLDSADNSSNSASPDNSRQQRSGYATSTAQAIAPTTTPATTTNIHIPIKLRPRFNGRKGD